jgi:hypothetical protein
MGLNFKLDVGTLQLYQQVACQRYRQKSIIAESFASKVSSLRNFSVAFGKADLVFAA